MKLISFGNAIDAMPEIPGKKMPKMHVICKEKFVSWSYEYMYSQSKKISNDQELIQSDTTFRPQNQKGNN